MSCFQAVDCFLEQVLCEHKLIICHSAFQIIGNELQFPALRVEHDAQSVEEWLKIESTSAENDGMLVSRTNPTKKPVDYKKYKKDFPCSHCEKVFSYKSHLNRHMQIHTGQFSFYCEICRRGFNERNFYTAHMNKHEGRTFPCEYCSKNYYTERSLMLHVRSAHLDKLKL